MATKSNKSKKTPKKSASKQPAKRTAAAAPARPKPKVTISKRPNFLKRLVRGNGERVTADRLYKLNRWLAVLYTLQAAAILLLSTAQSVPLTVHYLATDVLLTAQGGDTVLAGATQQVVDVSLAVAVAKFLLIAAVVHLLAATWLRKRYEQGLSRSVSTLRWVGYGVSSGVMVATIGLLFGVRDIGSLAMVFSLVLLASLLGLASDSRRKATGKPDWLVFGLAAFAAAIPWVVLIIYMISGALLGSAQGGYVYAATLVALIAFVLYGYTAFSQHQGMGKWKDYLYGERRYLMLSFAAKTAVAWLIFAAVLSP